MMTYKQAKDFQARLTTDTRKLSRVNKAMLQKIRAEQLLADGVVWESGGPVRKDELVNDILNRRYPLAQVNEATHVLYHAPSARWEACEHCHAKPATAIVNTDELRPGDVVLEHGMRIRIDEVREYRPMGASSCERAWNCPGTVLNVADVVAQHVIPASFLETYGYDEHTGWIVERRDAWTVQGNTLARWLVELPRPIYATWSSSEAPLDPPAGCAIHGQNPCAACASDRPAAAR